ncbi:hypothetical protein EVAR_61296_1 [Eumeta japonica]|uniref:Uncharacterized protein n=1 Tax=Eumeta variegata TaxID=151549 RepID=A0A4C1XI35_EUMVA|nr:hypothetical protein EVAR_61296_1 [Eumeta japonica]
MTAINCNNNISRPKISKGGKIRPSRPALRRIRRMRDCAREIPVCHKGASPRSLSPVQFGHRSSVALVIGGPQPVLGHWGKKFQYLSPRSSFVCPTE